MKVKLNLYEMLPVIRKAYDSQELQMFDENERSPKYAGPCAIGVCLPEDIRADLDSGKYECYAAVGLFGKRIFVTENEVMKDDIISIQDAHDVACYFPESIQKFEKILCELEKKYFREGSEL